MQCVDAEVHCKALVEDLSLSHKPSSQSEYYAKKIICFNYFEPMLFWTYACDVFRYFQLCWEMLWRCLLVLRYEYEIMLWDMIMEWWFETCFNELYVKLRFHNVLEKYVKKMILFEHKNMKAWSMSMNVYM